MSPPIDPSSSRSPERWLLCSRPGGCAGRDGRTDSPEIRDGPAPRAAQPMTSYTADQVRRCRLSHARRILRSSILKPVARARGYRSVESKAELKRFGFHGPAVRVPALLLPVWGVSGRRSTARSVQTSRELMSGGGCSSTSSPAANGWRSTSTH